MNKTVDPNDFKVFEKTEKMALVSTIDDEGDPHISLLTTLMAKDEKTMVVGQFMQGISKENMLKRPKSGFAIISLDMNFWTGLVDWYDVKTEGDEYIKYNNMQMWRFNTYFGIEKVHYGKLVGISDKRKLDFVGIGINYLKVAMHKKKYIEPNKSVMRPFATKIFNGLTNPKFISFISNDGYPVLVPIVQAQASGNSRIVFSNKPYSQMFEGLKPGARVAVECITMATESVLVKGIFSGFKKGIGFIDIDRVYNSMPPICGYIYPETPYKAVEVFE